MPYTICAEDIKRKVHKDFADKMRLVPLNPFVVTNSDLAYQIWLRIIGQDPYPRMLREGSPTSLHAEDQTVYAMKGDRDICVYVDGEWYQFERAAMIDPLLSDIEDVKEFLVVLFDDIVNRPRQIASWHDYQQASLQRIP